ncbi:hypothetical protein WN943_023836 [Citrus x changshan-huyou]
MIKAKSASYYTDNKNNLAKEKIISLYQLVYVCKMPLIFVLILHYIMELKIIIYFILGRHIIACIVSKSVFTFWSGSVECGFLPLQCLLSLKKEGVGVGICGSHPILEWGGGFPLPWGEVGVGIHSPLFPFYPYKNK